MIDLNKHKVVMLSILKDIFSDSILATSLGFKGGTALFFFYDLPRFSVDLDFNLIKPEHADYVQKKIKSILLKYGTIDDEAEKFYGYLIVLNYGVNQRKLKIEIRKQDFNDQYALQRYLGITMNVMIPSHLFAHKLCALLDRNQLTNRDIFDCWFFLSKQFPVNTALIEQRMEMSYKNYIQKCIDTLEKTSDSNLLNGLGEMLDNSMKTFVKTKLRSETIQMLHIYKEMPIVG